MRSIPASLTVKTMSKKPSAQTLFKEIRDLYGELIVPFMTIRRDMPFPTEPDREETDGEHAYTLAMIAITLSERMKLGLDTGLIAKYAMVHDLVEIHAGDTSVRASESELATKIDREHEAFLLIKERYLGHAPWVAEHIEAYEKRANEESKLVYAADKFLGALTRIESNGARWAEYYPDADGSDFHKVVERLRKKAEIFPPLLDLFDEIHNSLDELRPVYYEKTKGSKFRDPSQQR